MEYRLAFSANSTLQPDRPASRTSLASKQRSNFRDKLRRNVHQRDVLCLERGLNLRGLLVFGLVLVMRDDFLDAFLIPAWGKPRFLFHFRFLRWRRRKALLALPCGS